MEIGRDNRVGRKLALAARADALTAAGRHRHEAAQARRAVAAWEKDRGGDGFQAEDALVRYHRVRMS